MTEKQQYKYFENEKMALETFGDHDITVIEPIDMKTGRGEFMWGESGTGMYRCFILFRKNTILIYGDIGTYCFRQSDIDMPWLRGAIDEPDYLLSKLTSEHSKKYDAGATKRLAEAHLKEFIEEKDFDEEYDDAEKHKAEVDALNRAIEATMWDSPMAVTEFYQDILGSDDGSESLCYTWDAVGGVWPWAALKTFLTEYDEKHASSESSNLVDSDVSRTCPECKEKSLKLIETAVEGGDNYVTAKCSKCSYEHNWPMEVPSKPYLKLDAMKIINDGEPLDLLDLWMKLGAYVFIDTNADNIMVESKAGLKIEAKFTSLEAWPDKTDKPKFVKTIGDALLVSDIKFEFVGGAPPMTAAKVLKAYCEQCKNEVRLITGKEVSFGCSSCGMEMGSEYVFFKYEAVELPVEVKKDPVEDKPKSCMISVDEANKIQEWIDKCPKKDCINKHNESGPTMCLGCQKLSTDNHPRPYYSPEKEVDAPAEASP